ncbi:hypothetical protein [Ferrimonas balearica]|uniref:hypothetical protein n=1 Tax=Ferrimonas balearica TaxID=44012 RepID=UPI001C99CABC|nr:hypothetical protein [Ferrimonas balearica]MBY5994170.1 hypothetical protein [Ferrimonas balearica]
MGAWNQSIPMMMAGLLGLVALTIHLLRLRETQSMLLQSEMEMVAIQSNLERAMTLALGVCGTVMTLHLLWLHQLSLALLLVATAAITKTVWNIINLGRPGLGASLTTLTLTVAVIWTIAP